MGLRDRVVKLEEDIKKEQDEIHELNTKSQSLDGKISEIRKLKQAEEKLALTLKGLRERKETSKNNVEKLEEIINQEGGDTSEHVKS